MIFNKLIFGGRLVADPVVKPVGNGNLAIFTLVNNRERKDSEGNVKEETCFIEVEAWGKQADICAKYLHKSESVLIEGRLKQSVWDDKNGGGKRSKHILSCEEIVLLNPPSTVQSPTQVSPTQVSPTQVSPTQVSQTAQPIPKSKIDMIRDAGFGIKRIDSQPLVASPLVASPLAANPVEPTSGEDIEDLPF